MPERKLDHWLKRKAPVMSEHEQIVRNAVDKHDRVNALTGDIEDFKKKLKDLRCF